MADDAFVSGIGDQIVRLCQSVDTDVVFALDGPFRKALRILLTSNPTVIWRTISRFYEFATATERYWLEHLTGPSDHQFDGDGHNRQGVLFDVPEADLISWAKIDPPKRIRFLCEFYPILKEDSEGVRRWHPALESLAREFGRVSEFRQALGMRLQPTSWSGSLVPLLKVYLEPLQEWFTNPISELANWARETHRSLEKRIDHEKEREDERD
jgi:hypothetical protein